MAETLTATGPVKPWSNSSAIEGKLVWAPAKSIWYSTMLIAGLIGGVLCFSWQQNQADCHSFTKHDVGFLRDAFWQMHCPQVLTRPPQLQIEYRVTGDRFYRWLEATWRWQQFPLAIVLYSLGGWGFVFWGVCLRVAVSLTGHWCVVHIAHTRG